MNQNKKTGIKSPDTQVKSEDRVAGSDFGSCRLHNLLGKY